MFGKKGAVAVGRDCSLTAERSLSVMRLAFYSILLPKAIEQADNQEVCVDSLRQVFVWV